MRTENWVALGDSLTEGVGYSRHSYVSELVRLMREEGNHDSRDQMAASLVRLRAVGSGTADRFVKFSHAADVDQDSRPSNRHIWVWNLAMEGSTIESDAARLPFIESLKPSSIIVFRGSLESIIRPAHVYTMEWPFWVPSAWRTFAAMDPRCYFSTTWARRTKQRLIDTAKQSLRLALLAKIDGRPMLEQERVQSLASPLFKALGQMAPRVIVCGLLPVDEERFPGSSAQFRRVSDSLARLAVENNLEYLDWGAELSQLGSNGLSKLFYRDGFHPNQAGSRALAEILYAKIFRMRHRSSGL